MEWRGSTTRSASDCLLARFAVSAGDLPAAMHLIIARAIICRADRGMHAFRRMQQASAEIAYSSEETNFTLGLAELQTRLRRRSLIVLFTDFMDTVTAELLLENVRRIVCAPSSDFRHDPRRVLARLFEAAPAMQRRWRAPCWRRISGASAPSSREAGAARDSMPRPSAFRAADGACQSLSCRSNSGACYERLPLKAANSARSAKTSWRELDALLEIVKDDGMAALSAEDLGRLPLLYRSALSSLSVARSIALDRALLKYLEDLSLRAFLAIYARPMRVRRERARFPGAFAAASGTRHRSGILHNACGACDGHRVRISAGEWR